MSDLIDPEPAEDSKPSRNLLQIAEGILKPQWRNDLQRFASHIVLVVLAIFTIWITNKTIDTQLPSDLDLSLAATATAEPQVISPANDTAPTTLDPVGDPFRLARNANLHTDLPSRPRTEITEYTVESGDTLFGIAEKFGLTPETILWGNAHVLGDDPHSLRPGQVLLISPVNGVLRQVYEGDSLENYATWYKANVDDILFWPGNHLDYDNPQLVLEDWIIIPGGEREFVQWTIEYASDDAISSSGVSGRTLWPEGAGPGACAGGYTGGAGGTGTFIWPTNSRFISGNNYGSFHPGLDIAAGIGDPIYAVDSGVVIFAGWSNWGYGYMVVVSHRNGWQTLYAHLSQWNVSCGQSVSQGSLVGLGGSSGNSTGPHLHFEMNYNGVRVNPWSYLPPP